MKHLLETPPVMRRIAPALIIFLSCLTICGLALYRSIAQDPAYHDFADQRTLLSVPNFWNVVSNLFLFLWE